MFLSSANISFYVPLGREVHWGPVKGLFGDRLSSKTQLLGVIGFFVVAPLIMVGSHFAAFYLCHATGVFLTVWRSSLLRLPSCCRRGERETAPQDLDQPAYEQVALDNNDDGDKNEGDEGDRAIPGPSKHPGPSNQTELSWVMRWIIIVISSEAVFFWLVRPSNPAYSMLSVTLPLAPFVRPMSSFDGLAYLPGDFSWLGNRTTLDTPPAFGWLPPNEPLPGFTDWYSFNLDEDNEKVPKDRPQLHYNPAKDPLHLSNLHNDILRPLKNVLRNGEVKIKHIVLLKLESNRQDFFPLRADSYIMQRTRESHRHGEIPEEVVDRLSNISRTAELLTGSETGFYEKKDLPPFGGITATSAYTSGTYTLKSVTGSVCGVIPLPIKYNREFLYHIYQPCLPQILEALNRQPSTTSNTNDWTSWPWYSMWMQSVSGFFDQLNDLMPALGFNGLTSQETIAEPGSAYVPEKWEEVPDRGYMDKVLKKHMQKVVNDAKTNNIRLFLSHLTGATHRPWTIPRRQYENFLGTRWFALNDRMNRMLNALAYQDEWLADILQILKDAEIADETLLVIAGDQ